MKRFLLRSMWLFAALLALSTADATACAVCNGQDDHAMTQGAKLAVVMLGVVTYALLTGAAVLGGVWFARARRLAREEEALKDNTPGS